MTVLTYLLLALVTYQAESLSIRTGSHARRQSSATEEISSQFSEKVLFKETFEMNASMKHWRTWCKDPANLPMQGTGPDIPNAERQVLFDSVASPARKTTPFLWLHYGDGDFMSLTGHHSYSLEKADLTSQCVRDGLQDMFLGKSPPNMTSKVLVYQSLGKFFMCSHQNIFSWMDQYMTPARKAMAKFGWHDDFYLAPGNISSAPQDSWVVAAQKRKRPVVIVGPQHLDGLHCMFNQVAYFNIPIPTKGCGDVDRLVPQLIDFSRNKYPNESVMFVVAGAAIGKMIAYKAFQSLFDKDIFVEVGASLDGFGGRKSRAYNNPTRYCQPHYKKWLSPQACESHCAGYSPEIACCMAGTKEGTFLTTEEELELQKEEKKEENKAEKKQEKKAEKLAEKKEEKKEEEKIQKKEEKKAEKKAGMKEVKEEVKKEAEKIEKKAEKKQEKKVEKVKESEEDEEESKEHAGEALKEKELTLKAEKAKEDQLEEEEKEHEGEARREQALKEQRVKKQRNLEEEKKKNEEDEEDDPEHAGEAQKELETQKALAGF